MKKFVEENIQKPTDEMMKLVHKEKIEGTFSDLNLKVNKLREELGYLDERVRAVQTAEREIMKSLVELADVITG